MKSKYTYAVLMLLVTIGFWYANNYVFTEDNQIIESTDNVVISNDLIPSSTTGVIVNHDNYSLSYSEEYEQAEWVAYTLHKNQLTTVTRKRPYFIEDPKVITKSAHWRNYKNSGYDRGHLCPAGDRKYTLEAFEETFYTSNISPQENSFNGGVWNRLEQKVRRWAKTKGSVYVVTAGVLQKGLPTIGSEKVAVPKSFYKVICVGEGASLKVIAFLIPHKKSKAALENFVVTIDEIEAKTGIDFFVGLPKERQEAIESKIVTKGWF